MTTPALKLAFSRNVEKDMETLLRAAGMSLSKGMAAHYGAITDGAQKTTEIEVTFRTDEDAARDAEEGIVEAAIIGAGIRDTGTLTINARDETGIKIQNSGDDDLNGKKILVADGSEQALKDYLEEEGIEGAKILRRTRNADFDDYLRMGAADAVCTVVSLGKAFRIEAAGTNNRTGGFVMIENPDMANDKKRRLDAFKTRLIEAAAAIEREIAAKKQKTPALVAA